MPAGPVFSNSTPPLGDRAPPLPPRQASRPIAPTSAKILLPSAHSLLSFPPPHLRQPGRPVHRRLATTQRMNGGGSPPLSSLPFPPLSGGHPRPARRAIHNRHPNQNPVNYVDPVGLLPSHHAVVLFLDHGTKPFASARTRPQPGVGNRSQTTHHPLPSIANPQSRILNRKSKSQIVDRESKIPLPLPHPGLHPIGT
jgi:hypothetical protein